MTVLGCSLALRYFVASTKFTVVWELLSFILICLKNSPDSWFALINLRKRTYLVLEKKSASRYTQTKALKTKEENNTRVL